MARSYIHTTATGDTDTFSVPFPYLDKSHVRVFLAGLEVLPADFTWPTTGSIKLTAGNPPAGTVVTRRRYTPSDPMVTFQPGALEADDLNVGDRQALYLAQEAGDWSVTSSIGTDPPIIPAPTPGQLIGWDADGHMVNSETTTDERSQRIAADEALAQLIGTGGGAVPIFATLDAARIAPISPELTVMQVMGFANAGVPGLVVPYKRVASEPSHPGKFQHSNGSWWEMTGDKVHVGMFGALKSPTGDDTAAIQAAIQTVYAIGATTLTFNGMTEPHRISAAIFFNNYGVLGKTLHVHDLSILGTAATAGGAFVNVGRGSDVGDFDTIERTGNIVFHNLSIDGGSIPGENGLAFARAENVTVINANIKNCKRDYVGTREGGRCVTVHQRGRNITFIGLNGKNCSDYFHIGHFPDVAASRSGNTAITGITRGATTQVTLASNTFSVGQYVTLYNVGGTTGLNPSYTNKAQYLITASVGNVITLAVDSSAMSNWTSGGSCVRADLTNNRTPAIRILGGYAEDCEYSLINIEAANWPKTISPIQTVFVSGVVAKNCGTTATSRGLINGNNAVGLQMENVAVFNDGSHQISSIIRGSFQGSNIRGVFDVDTVTKAVVDIDPTLANPTGSGIDAGQTVHPYGTELDTVIDITAIIRTNAPPTIINGTDVAGTSIDLFYHNDVTVRLGGKETAYAGTLSNIALHFTNKVKITDWGSGRVFEGQLDTAGITFAGPNGNRMFGTATRFKEGITGTFTTADAKTATFTAGVLTGLA